MNVNIPFLRNALSSNSGLFEFAEQDSIKQEQIKAI